MLKHLPTSILLWTAASAAIASPFLHHRAPAKALPNLPKVPTTQQCSIYGSDEINCYEGPGESYSAKATVRGGHFYQCSCSKAGEDINGNTNWDFIPDNSLPGGGCYVPQYYTTQPCGNTTLPSC